MHFSIPDTEEFKDEKGSSYVTYNIHINGVFHCSVRYRQLHSLHEQLKKQFGASALPSFPSKKLLSLTPSQVEERRMLLEKYIQLVSQDANIVCDEIFNGFLLNAQQETQDQKPEEVTLDVYLMNGNKITANCLSTMQTNEVLENIGKSINLPDEYVYYFSLYVVCREQTGEVSIVRKMQDFESPYISINATKGTHRIVLRKSYWDSGYDDELMEDRVAMNLLYVQTLSDIERGWIIADKEIQRQLATLQAKGSKREYLQLARTLKYYGYIQFKPCTCDYPSLGTKVLISAGNRELNFRIEVAKDSIKEISFKVTRMRCWRIITSLPNQHNQTNSNTTTTKEELAFEYLINKDKLQWITVFSDQAILMSVCLQGMVEELLMKKNGAKIKRPNDKPRKGSWSYMKRDGSSHQICVSRSTSSDAILESTNYEAKIPRDSSMKKLSEKLSSVSMKPSSRSAQSPKPLVENDAFNGIGDEDL